MNLANAYKIISEKLTLWFQGLIRMLPNLLLATVVLVLGIFIAKWLKSLATRLIIKIIHSKTLGKLVISIFYVFLIGVVLFTVLTILKLDKAVTSLLAGAGILGLALAFAFQDIASNFISGIFISLRRPIHLGDVIKVKGYMGKVEEINMRDTIIKTFQGVMVIIPNKDIFQNPIENFSLFGKRRFDLKVGVSYAEDLIRVRSLTIQALKDMEGLSKDDEVTLIFQEFGESTINFTVRFWIDSPEQSKYTIAGSEAILILNKVYAENKISLPTPIRTIDFGIKGGVSLEDILDHQNAKKNPPQV